MNDFRADLHSHTIFSDGSDSPEKLIDLASMKGLKGLSITDHDTTKAYERAFRYASEKKFPLVSGVEFSAYFRQESIHILCYAFPLNSRPIQALCEKHILRRKERNQKILEKLKRLNIDIDEKDIPQTTLEGVIGRPHIAIALIKKGVVATMRDAFQKYLGEGKAAYEEGEKISVEETLQYIKEGKGKAVIAHPQLIIRKRLLKDLLEMPFDGVEGYYANIPFQEDEIFIKKAKEKGWLITGGSDYHGSIKPNIQLGSSWVNEETFNKLYNHFLSVSEKG